MIEEILLIILMDNNITIISTNTKMSITIFASNNRIIIKESFAQILYTRYQKYLTVKSFDTIKSMPNSIWSPNSTDLNFGFLFVDMFVTYKYKDIYRKAVCYSSTKSVCYVHTYYIYQFLFARYQKCLDARPAAGREQEAPNSRNSIGGCC